MYSICLFPEHTATCHTPEAQAFKYLPHNTGGCLSLVTTALVTTFSPQYKHCNFILLVGWIILHLFALNRAQKLGSFARGHGTISCFITRCSGPTLQ
jgi:hypothetical protein